MQILARLLRFILALVRAPFEAMRFLIERPALIPLFILPALYFRFLWSQNLTGALISAGGAVVYGVVMFAFLGRSYLTLLAIRYLFKRRIALVAVLSVMLCTAMVLVVGSIMEGFLRSAREAMHGAKGDITLRSDFRGLPFYEEFQERVRTGHPSLADPKTGKPAVQRVSALMYTWGLINFSQRDSQTVNRVQVVGVRYADMADNRRFLLGLDSNRTKIFLNDEALRSLSEKGVPSDVLRKLGSLWIADSDEDFTRRLQKALTPEEYSAHASAIEAVAERLVFDDNTPMEKLRVPELRGRRINLPGKDGKPVTFEGGGILMGKEMVSARDSSGRLVPVLDSYKPLRLTVLPPSETEKMQFENVANKLFEFEDFYRSGVYDQDRESVYVDFEVLQDMLRMKGDPEEGKPPYCHMLQIDFAPGVSLEEGRRVVERAWRLMIDEIEAEQRVMAAAFRKDPNKVPPAKHGPKFVLNFVERIGPDGSKREVCPDLDQARVRGYQATLNADVAAGKRELSVGSTVGFAAGDRVTVADAAFLADAQPPEQHVIAEIHPNQLVLEQPLKHPRRGPRSELPGSAVITPGPYGNVFTLTWEESMQTFLTAVQKEKVMMLTLFGIISMVAVMLVLSIFIQIVKEKTRDIGIIKSVGGSSESVAGVFLLYAGCIGSVGTALGLGLGCWVVWRINDIHDLIARATGVVIWDPSIYVLPKIPNFVDPLDAAWVGGIGLMASLIAAVVPAFLAARLAPVRALAYE